MRDKEIKSFEDYETSDLTYEEMLEYAEMLSDYWRLERESD